MFFFSKKKKDCFVKAIWNLQYWNWCSDLLVQVYALLSKPFATWEWLNYHWFIGFNLGRSTLSGWVNPYTEYLTSNLTDQSRQLHQENTCQIYLPRSLLGNPSQQKISRLLNAFENSTFIRSLCIVTSRYFRSMISPLNVFFCIPPLFDQTNRKTVCINTITKSNDPFVWNNHMVT
jgi:hypothetical protein